MPKYLTMFSYTAEAAAAMVAAPADRGPAAHEIAEATGCRVETFYWMLGPHDGLVIYEAPDVVAAGTFAQVVASSGSIHGIQTHQLIEAEDAVAMQRAAQTARDKYRRPGS